MVYTIFIEVWILREWIPTQEEMFNQAMKRPRGYHRMMPWEQWNIDADLGIRIGTVGVPMRNWNYVKIV